MASKILQTLLIIVMYKSVKIVLENRSKKCLKKTMLSNNNTD